MEDTGSAGAEDDSAWRVTVHAAHGEDTKTHSLAHVLHIEMASSDSN